ncbi:hypothetical protein Hesp01_30250 [Herbidospora sp. NBRC 101105]|nr:hypothetical protein Hesp01_30250 [Herbidospora sp. NBRC 101105]
MSPHGELAQSSAARVAPSSTLVLPASVLKNARNIETSMIGRITALTWARTRNVQANDRASGARAGQRLREFDHVPPRVAEEGQPAATGSPSVEELRRLAEWSRAGR